MQIAGLARNAPQRHNPLCYFVFERSPQHAYLQQALPWTSGCLGVTAKLNIAHASLRQPFFATLAMVASEPEHWWVVPSRKLQQWLLSLVGPRLECFSRPAWAA
mmetsp:Transcript_73648/g.145978  ORF Transcript_73648/g.145978 Transcript_73648/m.145978 type:complete len:104 (+) Transcript_73648:670-981(+)